MALSSNDDDDALEITLGMLQQESSSVQFNTAMETLLKILRNIAANPHEEKYRQIRKENRVFNERVWSFDGARQFLYATGWIDVDDSVVLTDDTHVSAAICLLEQRLSARGSESASNHSSTSSGATSRSVNKGKTKDASDQRLMEQLKREKEERRRISEQIRADRQEISARRLRDSRARQRQFGANIKRFEDIGVDLNRGGG